jgi:pseudaminic acid synthase
MKSTIKIGNRVIGEEYPTYIVAEMSANHNQVFEQAIKIVHAAKEAGADAVKLQTYTPDSLTLRSDLECFRISGGTVWDGRTLYDVYSEACMPWEWTPNLMKEAHSIGLDLFSTAFDIKSIDLLEEIGAPIHKVSSFEIVDIPLIQKMAQTGKPLVISTGMATLEEINEAVQAASTSGTAQIILLKCTSAYPASPEELNLRTIPNMIKTFGLPVGLSDHTLGTIVPVAAVALGARMVEKHLTLSRAIPGPDSNFSLEPNEFKGMVQAIRNTEKALGEIRYGATKQEEGNRNYRRSLFVVKDIKAREAFTKENVRSIRPAVGLPPKYLGIVIGKKAAKDIPAGTPLTWSNILGKIKSDSQ